MFSISSTPSSPSPNRLAALLVILAVLAAPLSAALPDYRGEQFRAYGSTVDATEYSELDEAALTFANSTATAVLLWDAANLRLDLDQGLEMDGALSIGGTVVLDASRNLSSITNSTGSTNVVFSDTPTLATPNWTGTATGVGLTLSGTLSAAATTLTGALAVPDGNAGAPGITFTTDADSGFYQSGDGYVDVAIGGARVARFGAGELWTVQDLLLNGSADILFDVDRDTYLTTPSDDVLDFYIGAARAGGFGATGNFDFVNDLTVTGSLEVGNDTGTGSFVRATSPTLVTPSLGVASATSLSAGGLTVSGDAAVTGEIDAGSIVLDGTEIVDASRNLDNIANVTGAGSFVRAASPTLTGTTNVADLAASGDVTALGDVGVGTASPSVPLHITAGGTTPSLDDSTMLVIQDTSSSDAQVDLTLLSGNGASAHSVINFGDVDDEDAGVILYSATDDDFRIRTGGGATEMYIESGVGLTVTTNVITPIVTIGSAVIRSGTGSPESVVTGNVGDLFLRTDGGASTTLYVKESGSATNTGWVAK